MLLGTGGTVGDGSVQGSRRIQSTTPPPTTTVNPRYEPTRYGTTVYRR